MYKLFWHIPNICEEKCGEGCGCRGAKKKKGLVKTGRGISLMVTILCSQLNMVPLGHEKCPVLCLFRMHLSLAVMSFRFSQASFHGSVSRYNEGDDE